MLYSWDRENSLDRKGGLESMGNTVGEGGKAQGPAGPAVGLQEQEARNAGWPTSPPWLHLVLKTKELGSVYHVFILQIFPERLLRGIHDLVELTSQWTVCTAVNK